MDDILIINSELVKSIINQNKKKIIQIVKETYLDYRNGNCINPDSFFLQFPDHDRNRIIGLAASNTVGENQISGIKWVASYPDNLKQDIPRASASIILNDYNTGRVKAFIEGSLISAARTAASAALAAQLLVHNSNKKHYSCLFVGCGVISKTIMEFMLESGIHIDTIYLYDLNNDSANKFKQSIKEFCPINVEVVSNLVEGFSKSEIITFATTAIKPYVSKNILTHDMLNNKIVLGVSLRDLCPEIINESNNILDDINHCLKANTSVHLTEQRYKNRNFINGTISDLIVGSISLAPHKATILSPFGMGVLDLNVAKYIYDSVKEKKLGLMCAFHD